MDKETERKEKEVDELIGQAMEHIRARYLDPKNQKKGTHIGVEPPKMYKWIEGEAHEAFRAWVDDEGVERELEELGDVMLLSAMRIDQIIKNK